MGASIIAMLPITSFAALLVVLAGTRKQLYIFGWRRCCGMVVAAAAVVVLRTVAEVLLRLIT